MRLTAILFCLAVCTGGCAPHVVAPRGAVESQPVLSAFSSAVAAEPTETPSQPMKIDSAVALSSLATIGDLHLEKMANSLRAFAESTEARTANWKKIQGPLAVIAKSNAEALHWFALPDGSYWSLEKGKEPGNLKSRAYFPRLLQRETVIGDLVRSTSTGNSVAIVAVPVIRNGAVVGALGASIYLDRLSARIEKEMGLDETMIFYSFDRQPIVGLNWDPAIIFTEPMKLGESVKSAFDKMLKLDSGTVEYSFRGKTRTVHFRKSSVSGWWYAFGLVPEGRGAAVQ